MERLELTTKKFCAVRDSISPEEHPIAWRVLWTVPMALYWGRTVEECRDLLFAYERELLAGKYGSDILKVASNESLWKLSEELNGKRGESRGAGVLP